ncbi:MAG: serine/threonine-protein kinase [Dermatophilus congolensis]|nr:serine/threonine-protein kinase [Dermatophilus congolensis]
MRGSSTGSTWATQPVPAPGSPDRLDRLGGYVLRQQLGAGGMGVVHLATDRAGRAVAIKELPAHIAGDDAARARLRREFTSLQRVDHPRVAPVLDADLDGARPYIVTRYIPGRSLEQRIIDAGPLERHQLAHLATGLSEALDAIHSAGVVHRDLKPTNVLMLDDDPVVIDFGIAQAADDLRLTRVGVVMGTPGFLAPEVLDGAAATPAVDWWAWAATLAYAATGRPPFGRGPLDAVLARVHRGEPDLAGVDLGLAAVLRAALSAQPARRPAPAELTAAVVDWAAGRAVTVSSPAGSSADEAPTEYVPAVGHAAPRTERIPAPDRPAAPPTMAQPKLSTRVMPAVLRDRGRRADAAAAAAREPRVQYAAFGAAPQRVAESVAPAAHTAHTAPVSVPPPVAQPQSWQPETVPPVRRPSVAFPLFGVLALFVALGASLPVLTVVAGILWSALARTVYASMRGMQERRIDRGPRKADVFLAVLASPLRFVPATLTAALAALGCVVVAVAGMFGTAALVSVTGGLRADPFSEISLAAGMTIGALVAWWGIGGTPLRRGSRVLVRAVSPGRFGPTLVGVLLLAVAAWLAIRLQGTGVGPDWAPLADVISGTLISWF